MILRSSFFLLSICVLISLSTITAYAQECKSTTQTAVLTGENKDKKTSNEEITIDFDHFATGPIPDDFLPILSGKGKAADWEIRPEPTAHSSPKVLAQISMEEENFRFPLLLYTKFAAKNIEIRVHFKPVSGKIDQAAGIVARYQDEKHFYIVQASALENEVKLFKVVDNVHQPIKGVSTSVELGKWHEVLLKVNDTHFHVCFDGTPLFEAEDDTYKGAGRVGIATKSDSVTVFDDLLIIGNERE